MDRNLVIAVGGQKGGGGKTTFVTNLAAYLVQKKDVDLTLVDTDSKQNSAGKWSVRRRGQENAKNVMCQLIDGDLREPIKDLKKRYQMVLIDAGGRDSAEFRTSLLVADICLIPFAPSQYDIDTLPFVNDLVEQSRVYNETSTLR